MTMNKLQMHVDESRWYWSEEQSQGYWNGKHLVEPHLILDCQKQGTWSNQDLGYMIQSGLVLYDPIRICVIWSNQDLRYMIQSGFVLHAAWLQEHYFNNVHTSVNLTSLLKL